LQRAAVTFYLNRHHAEAAASPAAIRSWRLRVGHSKRRRVKCRQTASSDNADGEVAWGSLAAKEPGSICTRCARRSCDIFVANSTAGHTVLACIYLQPNMLCTQRPLSGQNWPRRRAVCVFRRNDSDSKARAGSSSFCRDHRGMRTFSTGEDHG